MKRIISFIFVAILSIGFVSCSNSQKEEFKKVSAQGLSEGITKLMLENEVVVCDDEQVLKDYVLDKACVALDAQCGSSLEQYASLASSKSFIAKFACKTAVKIVMPMILPSKHLPSELKQAGCQIKKIDELANDWVPKLCEKF